MVVERHVSLLREFRVRSVFTTAMGRSFLSKYCKRETVCVCQLHIIALVCYAWRLAQFRDSFDILTRSKPSPHILGLTVQLQLYLILSLTRRSFVSPNLRNWKVPSC